MVRACMPGGIWWLGWALMMGLSIGLPMEGVYGQDRLTDGLLEELGEGSRESLKQGSGLSPERGGKGGVSSEVEGEPGLSGIEMELQESVRCLMRGDTSIASVERQRRILDGFDRLIQAVDESQRSRGSSASQEKKQSVEKLGEKSTSQTANVDGLKEQMGQMRNRGMEEGAGSEQGRGEVDRQMKEVHMNAMAEYQQRVWGHLPQRLRQQFESAPFPRFLPSYRQGIEEYYRRLNQERSTR